MESMVPKCSKCGSKNITNSYYYNHQKKCNIREIKCRKCGFVEVQYR